MASLGGAHGAERYVFDKGHPVTPVEHDIGASMEAVPYLHEGKQAIYGDSVSMLESTRKLNKIRRSSHNWNYEKNI